LWGDVLICEQAYEEHLACKEMEKRKKGSRKKSKGVSNKNIFKDLGPDEGKYIHKQPYVVTLYLECIYKYHDIRLNFRWRQAC